MKTITKYLLFGLDLTLVKLWQAKAFFKTIVTKVKGLF